MTTDVAIKEHNEDIRVDSIEERENDLDEDDSPEQVPPPDVLACRAKTYQAEAAWHAQNGKCGISPHFQMPRDGLPMLSRDEISPLSSWRLSLDGT